MPWLSALDHSTRARERAWCRARGRCETFLITEDGRVNTLAIAVSRCPVSFSPVRVGAAMGCTRARRHGRSHGTVCVRRIQGLLHLGLFDRQAKGLIDPGWGRVAGAQGEKAQTQGAGPHEWRMDGQKRWHGRVLAYSGVGVGSVTAGAGSLAGGLPST